MAEKTVVLPDRFHTLKRTLLIFCALIILSAVPGAVSSDGSQALLPLLKNVPIEGLRKILWIGAAYYAVGCLLEGIVAAQDVSKFLAVAGNAANLNQALQALADAFDHRRADVAAYLGQLKDDGQKLLDGAPPVAPEAREELQKHLALHRTLWSAEEKKAASLDDQIGRAYTGYLERVTGDLAKFQSKLSAVSENDQVLVKKLTELRKSIWLMDAAVTAPRHALFWGFEAAPSVLAFVTATVLTWCPPAVDHFQRFLSPAGWFGW